MTVSRRSFVRALGLGSAGALAVPSWVGARGLEAATAEPSLGTGWQAANDLIKLDSNENPNGPVPAARRAIMESFRRAALYPSSAEVEVREAIARANGLAADQVMLGAGSGEILRLAVQAYCSPARHLVSALPSFESPAAYARTLGLPLREVPLTSDLAMDLDAMVAQSRGAGLVFFCNPNNPTGHVVGSRESDAFIRAVLAADPEVIVLVDEAYHEFVDDPAYATSLPLIATHPRVVISRTFSKIYGIAGMRAGYAFGQPATLARMNRLRLPNGIGGLTQAAAIAALGDPAQVVREARQNREALLFTERFFRDAGFGVVPSQANFVLVDIRRDAARFREDARTAGVAVGRPFPPLVNHTRISIGTMDEMRRATRILKGVLG
jgi:histidinol-phosphate aminotransferase